MRKYIVLFVKGFVIGIGKIIPGVSGAVLAISLGVYETAIVAINNFFSNVSKHLKFLSILALGVTCAIILVSNLVKYMLNSFYLPTMLLFIGLIIGGIPMLFSKVKNKRVSKTNVAISIVFFSLVVLLSFLKSNNQMIFTNDTYSYFLLIIIGIIDAATMVIPGISGTAVLMLIGCYDTIINTFSNLMNFDYFLENLQILFPFTIGVCVGIILIVKLMAYLFKYHEEKTYYAIIGFALSSIFLLFIQTMSNNYQFSHILIGLLLLIVGYKLSRKLDC